MTEEAEIAELLRHVKEGEANARDELLRCVFGELRALAQGHMRAQPPGHTLQPTALVNEAYLRLFRKSEPEFSDRAHFFRAASRAMRCFLVDHAREKERLKRLPPGERLPIDGLGELFQEGAQDLVALDAALERFSKIDQRAAEVVELRFFGGREEHEVADMLGVSTRTVERDWTVARAWLRKELA